MSFIKSEHDVAERKQKQTELNLQETQQSFWQTKLEREQTKQELEQQRQQGTGGSSQGVAPDPREYILLSEHKHLMDESLKQFTLEKSELIE